MPCERFERRLHQLLDERRRPEEDEQLLRHAEMCPGCCGLLAGEVALAEGLACRETPQPSPGFVDAVLAIAECGARNAESVECESDQQADRRAVRRQSVALPKRKPAPDRQVSHRRRRWFGWLVTAAALLAVAPTAYWSLRGRESGPTPSSLAPGSLVQGESESSKAQSDSELTGHGGLTPRHSPEGGGRDIGSDGALAAASASPQTGDAASTDADLAAAADGLTAEQRYALMLERLQSRIPELGDTLGLTGPGVQGAAAVSQITDRLRSPLTSTLNSTLNVLRTALPTGDAQSPQKPQAGLATLRATFLA